MRCRGAGAPLGAKPAPGVVIRRVPGWPGIPREDVDVVYRPRSITCTEVTRDLNRVADLDLAIVTAHRVADLSADNHSVYMCDISREQCHAFTTRHTTCTAAPVPGRRRAYALIHAHMQPCVSACTWLQVPPTCMQTHMVVVLHQIQVRLRIPSRPDSHIGNWPVFLEDLCMIR